MSQLRGDTSDLVIDDKEITIFLTSSSVFFRGAFGVKYSLPLQTSCTYSVLFDDNLNVYVEADERLLVTHAVEHEGATTVYKLTTSFRDLARSKL